MINNRKKISIVISIIMVISLFCPNIVAKADTQGFLVIVSNPLYNASTTLQNDISTYMNDINNEGWSSKLIKVNNVSDSGADYVCSTPASLKSVIKQFYNQGYKGFVIIGSSPAIPTAYWEYKDTDTSKEPTDLYYADMNDWVDNDNDGAFDSYTSTGVFEGANFQPEMVYGRISAGAITSSITDEAAKTATYLEKVHNYRVNGSNLPIDRRDAGLEFQDSNLRFCKGDIDRFRSFVRSVKGMFDDAITTKDSLTTELQRGYKFAALSIHSANDFHQLRTADKNNISYDNSFDLNYLESLTGASQPKVHYLNLYCCSACRYDDKVNGKTPNLGEVYLFNNDYTLTVTGSTGPWGYVPDKTFFDVLSNGMSIGEAYRECFTRAVTSGEEGCPKGVLLGDPTLSYKIDPINNNMPYVATNFYNDDDSKPQMVATVGTTFTKDIAISDPENDYVDVKVTGLPTGATYDSVNKRITWTPTADQAFQTYYMTITAENPGYNNKYTEDFSVYVDSTGYKPSLGYKVDYDSSTLIQGKSFTIYYNGSLANSSTIKLHWGYNNWTSVTDVVMTKDTSTGFWKGTITIPSSATKLDFAFTNGSSWDNNNTHDWHLPVWNSTPTVQVTPGPTAGKSVTIYYTGSLASTATSMTLHWGYNSWVSPTDVTMTKVAAGRWAVTLTVPSNSYMLNMCFRNNAGTYDNNGSTNYNYSVAQ